MVRSVTRLRRDEPSSLCTGMRCSWPYRSHRAMSTAALALVLCTPALCTRAVTDSRSSTSRPRMAGAISSRTAPMMPPAVSPVMGPVGGASP